MELKKLLITSTDMMMVQFLAPHVRFLAQNGFHVELACSDVGNRMADVRAALGGYAKAIHTVRLERTPFRLKNLLGLKDLCRLLRQNRYDFIWTNEPVMGAITRIAARYARRNGTKVLYLCHGFHFYKGSGLLSWLTFYPAERFLARFCDCILCINHEDETRAGGFPVQRVAYMHCIGMDTRRFSAHPPCTDIRTELGIPKSSFLLLSVGELNENKNHQIILKALSEGKDPSVHYLICGKGPLLQNLTELSGKLGISEQVHFLGYRSDVPDIYSQADVFVLPSYREGLSVASLEAMYCGLPLITSRVRGSADYLQDGISGFLRDAEDAAGFADAIQTLRADPDLRRRCGDRNRKAVLPYCIDHVQPELLRILKSL